MNDKTIVIVCGYAGDSKQIRELMPFYEHHKCPIVIMSPEDSPIVRMGPHICRFAGKRAYTGQPSLDRQWLQMRMMLEYSEDHEWFLLHDSDSIILTPEIPAYLYERDDVIWSNQVEDFRKPGETYADKNGTYTWPEDYHAGHPLIAMQPPYFMHRKVLTQLVSMCHKWIGDPTDQKNAVNSIEACPITPFIDWYMVQMCVKAHVEHLPFIKGASCETVTPNGFKVMSNCVKDGSVVIHSIKTGGVAHQLYSIHRKSLRK